MRLLIGTAARECTFTGCLRMDLSRGRTRELFKYPLQCPRGLMRSDGDGFDN